MKPITELKILTPICGAVLGAVILMAPAMAAAQEAPSDHLKCYRIKDTKMFKRAEANLQAQSDDFGLQNCEIKPKGKTYCVPVQKTVTNLEDGSPLELGGDDQSGGRICYKVSCPNQDIAPKVVSDQFGTRSIEFKKSVRLCTPAVEGAFPTTTLPPTTTTLPIPTTTLPAVTTTTLPTATTLPVPTTLPDGGTLELPLLQ
ncbi:MAG TPA: hypothetical protein VEC57_11860 [Candidatus Limnocylindrales bacterium]|nr:hypothetical protein [Candidatus Limnocylindrales bacterium]